MVAWGRGRRLPWRNSATSRSGGAGRDGTGPVFARGNHPRELLEGAPGVRSLLAPGLRSLRLREAARFPLSGAEGSG